MKYLKWVILAIVGLAIRIFLIEVLSESDNYYDGQFSIFTDLDYKVYLDGSLYESPYDRHTYRYSPLLAWIMAPSYTHNQKYGKYLLTAFDMLACFFYFKIFADRKGYHNIGGGIMVAALMYTNPFLIYLSIRGSCEGITMTLASAFLYFYFGGEANGNMTPEERA
jgi:GPI mannosyltransferase 1 subunit M